MIPSIEKNIWSSKIQSFILIENQQDDQKIIDNSLSIARSNHKDLSFSFDSIVPEKCSGNLLQLLDRSIDLIRLGFNSSIYFNGISKNRQEDAELKMIKNQIEKLYAGFEKDESNVEDGIQSCGEILFSRSVNFSCYELFDNRIVDLCSLSIDTTNFMENTNSTKKNEDNIRLLHGTVTGLTRILCISVESAMAVVSHAMQMRLHLRVSTAIAPHEVKASDSGIPPPPRLIGAIGFVFIVAEVEQLIYTIASGKVRTRTSRLEYVSFAPVEVLTFKPDKHEVMKAVRSSTRNKLISVEDVKVQNSKLLNALQGGLQSLSALTRVVNALKGDVSVGDNLNLSNCLHSSSNDSTASNSSTSKQHVPYRDSLFTQLLKPSLQGNCNVCMVTTINGTSESLSNMLWFASNIGSFYNNIWDNNTSRQPHVITEELQLKLRAFISKTKSKAQATAGFSDSKTENSEAMEAEKAHLTPKLLPMVAFNGALSDFHSNIVELASISDQFWRVDAETERQRSLYKLGINPILMPIPTDENDTEKKVKIDISAEIIKSLNDSTIQPPSNVYRRHKEDLEKMQGEIETLPSIEEKVDLLTSGKVLSKLDNQLFRKRISWAVSSGSRPSYKDILHDVPDYSNKSAISNREEMRFTTITSPQASAELSSPSLLPSADNADDFHSNSDDWHMRILSLPREIPSRNCVPASNPILSDIDATRIAIKTVDSSSKVAYAGKIASISVDLVTTGTEFSEANTLNAEESRINSSAMIIPDKSIKSRIHNERLQLPGFHLKTTSPIPVKNIEKQNFPLINGYSSRPLSAYKSNISRRPSSALNTNRKGRRKSDPSPLGFNGLQNVEETARQPNVTERPKSALYVSINRKNVRLSDPSSLRVKFLHTASANHPILNHVSSGKIDTKNNNKKDAMFVVAGMNDTKRSSITASSHGSTVSSKKNVDNEDINNNGKLESCKHSNESGMNINDDDVNSGIDITPSA